MFLSPQTTKFIEERDHYVRQNALRPADLTDSDLKKIADRVGVSLMVVLEDAHTYKFDIKTHKPQH